MLLYILNNFFSQIESFFPPISKHKLITKMTHFFQTQKYNPRSKSMSINKLIKKKAARVYYCFFSSGNFKNDWKNN